VVRERHLAEQFAIVVTVEGAPAAIGVLHRLEPAPGTVERRLDVGDPVGVP